MTAAGVTPFRYRWFAAGDVNAFFALTFDNLALLAAMGSILIGVFHLPAEMVLSRMVPGTAFGVLVGDWIYTWMAVRLARAEERDNVCAMPFGIDTPSLFVLCFGVVGPAYVISHDADTAWHVGMAVLALMGLVKVAASFLGERLRRALPPAALIGVLSAVAIVLIMFFPFTKLLAEPVGGMVAFGVVMLALVGRVKAPLGLPVVPIAALAGLLTIAAATWFGYALPERAAAGAHFGIYLPWPRIDVFNAWPLALKYLPIALPVALVTVVGGIDNTESARLAGDRYATRSILLAEGVATLAAAFCGGVVQNTPYIGHPAYKQMGARAGYTLVTGLVIGLGAMTGLIGVVVGAVPDSLLVPILVYVGIQMAAQAMHVTERAYVEALPLAIVPVIAYLVNLQIGAVLADAQLDIAQLSAGMQASLQALRMLGNGFVFTAMVWVTLVVWMIEKRGYACLLLCVAAALMTAIGLMHSPYPDGRVFVPDHTTPQQVYGLVAAYLVVGAMCALSLARGRRRQSGR